MRSRSIVTLVLIGIAVVATALFLAVKSNATPEKAAEAILKKTYNATPHNYDSLTNAIKGSQEDNTVIFSYLQKFYGGDITENGLYAVCNNRIPYRAVKIAHEENANIQVSSIKLEPTDAEAGSKRYNYIVQIHTLMDAAKTFTFKGHIKLIRESGHWKLDAIN